MKVFDKDQMSQIAEAALILEGALLKLKIKPEFYIQQKEWSDDMKDRLEQVRKARAIRMWAEDHVG